MYVIKFMGISCTVIASGIFGYLKYLKLKIRYDALCEFNDFMIAGKTQFDFLKISIPDFLKEQFSCNSGYVSMFAYNLYINLENSNAALEKMWIQSINSTYSRIILQSDIEVLYLYGKFLGNCDIYDQSDNIEYCNQRLQKQINDAETVMKEKGTIYRKTSLAFGAVMAIMFI